MVRLAKRYSYVALSSPWGHFLLVLILFYPSFSKHTPWAQTISYRNYTHSFHIQKLNQSLVD